MGIECTKLTVFFEDPFWVGVFERAADGRLSVCKVTFGAEPREYEVWEFVLNHYHARKFSPSVDAEMRKTPDNPKRRQRDARKQMRAPGVGTKSQQALQLQREQMKTQRKQSGREQREAEQQRRLRMKREKRKAKHRGR